MPYQDFFDTVLEDENFNQINLRVYIDYTPYEKPVYDIESTMCGPGCNEEVQICKAINKDTGAEYKYSTFEESNLEMLALTWDDRREASGEY